LEPLLIELQKISPFEEYLSLIDLSRGPRDQSKNSKDRYGLSFPH
jgi:hypothetical protein